MGNSNSALFYHSKKSFIIISYHFIISLASRNSIFIKILFLIFLYYFFPTVTFSQTWHDSSHFPGLSNSHFFSSLSPSTSSTGSIHRATHRSMIHRSTYPNPSPHTQSHTHTQTQIIKPLTEPHTHKPSNQLEPTTEIGRASCRERVLMPV